MSRSIQVFNLRARCFQNLPIQGSPGWLTPEVRWEPAAGASLKEQQPGVEPVQFFPWRLGSHTGLPALSRSSRVPSLSPTAAPRCYRKPQAAGKKQAPLSRSLPHLPSRPSKLCPSWRGRQGCLTCLGEAGATWEVSGSCGKLAAGERPLSPPPPPPSSRNCLHHIREDRAPETGREWVRGWGGRSPPGPWEPAEPSDSLTAGANVPHP